MKLREALDQVEDERWQCATCTAPRVEDDCYCAACRMYWDDCANGFGDDDYFLAPEARERRPSQGKEQDRG